MRALVAIVFSLLAAYASAQTLSVLEHPHCADSPSRVVRNLFAYGPSGWRPAAQSDPVPNAGAQWWPTARQFAELSIQTQPPARKPAASWEFARDFYLSPTSPEALPELPNTAREFGGWCEPPKNRPLLVTSQRGFMTEVLATASAPLTEVQRKALLRALLKTYRSPRLCAYSRSDGSKTEPVRLTLSDLVATVSLTLDSSSILVGLDLKRPVFECDDERGDTDLPRWFVLSQTARHVGSGLTLIQQLQMPSSQKQYFIFWFTGYNEDGYVLHDAGFRKPVQYTWKYH